MPEKDQSFIEKFGERAIIFICLGLGGWWLQNQWTAVQDLAKAIQAQQLYTDSKYMDKEYAQHIVQEAYRNIERIEGKLDKAMNLIREINTRQSKGTSHTHLPQSPRRRLEDWDAYGPALGPDGR